MESKSVTGPWRCATCGEMIETVKDGWVEWLRVTNFTTNESRRYGLRLVHHKPASPIKTYNGCQYEPKEELHEHGAAVQNSALNAYMGPDGLMYLLAMLAVQKLPTEEIVELTKRLHIPGYEQARGYFDAALVEGIVNSRFPGDFYTQEEIQNVIEWVKTKEYE